MNAPADAGPAGSAVCIRAAALVLSLLWRPSAWRGVPVLLLLLLTAAAAAVAAATADWGVDPERLSLM